MNEAKGNVNFSGRSKEKSSHSYNIYIYVICLVCWLLFPSPARLQAQDPQVPQPLVEGEITVQGLSLSVDPVQQTVPVNIPTTVNTTLAVDNPQMLKGMSVKAELYGPAFPNAPLSLTTLPNHAFSIPGLNRKGTYTLKNIRLESGGKQLLAADPSYVTLQVIDMIVTRVESRPLSLKEIREKGISITDEDFTVLNFSIGFTLHSKEVRYEFPVVYSHGDPYVPAIGGGGHAPGGGGGARLGPSGGRVVPFEFKPVTAETQNSGGSGTSLDSGKVTGVLIFNNDVAYLNQFFSVMFIVNNNAPDGSPLALEDLAASITFPEGLKEAETNPPHLVGTPIPVRCPGPDEKPGTADDLDVIIATFSGMAEFLAQGTDVGNHIVDIDFQGTLTGLPNGDVPVKGKASGVVVVKNPTFNITFAHPRVVRDKEEYEIMVHVQNTSKVAANLFSLAMPAGKLFGCHLKSGKQVDKVDFETIAPNETVTVRFEMVSEQNGEIRASATEFDDGSGLTGTITLTAGVGECGIPLSPDTLVLPRYAYELPEDLLNAAMVSLGEAYSIATTPPAGVPSGLPLVGRTAVTARVLELTEAGQRILYNPRQDESDPLKQQAILESVEVFTLDWCGNRTPDLSYDILRRMTTKAAKLNRETAVYFDRALETQSPEQFQYDFTATCSYKEPFISAMLSFPGGERCADLVVEDYYTDQLKAAAGEAERGIPFSEWFFLQEPSGAPVDFALIGSIDPASYDEEKSFILNVYGKSSGTFDLSLIVPVVQVEKILTGDPLYDESGDGPEKYINNGFKQVLFTGVSCEEGGHMRVVFNRDTGVFNLQSNPDGDDVWTTLVTGADSMVIEPPLRLINARQDVRAHDSGHVVALLFNRALDNETVKAVEDGDGNDINAANFYVEREQKEINRTSAADIYARFLQPSQRVVLLGLDNPISPFTQSRVRLSDLKDVKGGLLEPAETWMDITSKITDPGGVVFGRVLTAQGEPVEGAGLRLAEPQGDGRLFNSYTISGEGGYYQFDFVKVGSMGFEVIAKYEGDGLSSSASEKSRLMFDAQRLNMDLFLQARGKVKGRLEYLPNHPAESGYPANVYAHVMSENGLRTYVTQCEDGGEFFFDNLPVGNVNLNAWRYGGYFGVAATVIPGGGQTAEADISMEQKPTGTVRGQVLLSDGITPLELLLGEKPQRIEPVMYMYYNGKPFKFADYPKDDGYPTGKFVFENVPVGDEFTIYCNHHSWPEGMSGYPITGKLNGDGEELYVSMVLRDSKSGKVSGTVTTHDDVLVEGCRVVLKETGNSVTTGADGAFSFDVSRLGTFTVMAYDTVKEQIISATAQVYTQDEEARVKLVFAAPVETGSISGVVTDADGNLLPNIRLHFFDANYVRVPLKKDENGEPVEESYYTGANGAFVRDGLPVGGYVVAAESETEAGVARTVIPGPGVPGTCNIQTRAKGHLRIRVVDASGTPTSARLEINTLKFRINPGVSVGFYGSRQFMPTPITTGEVLIPDVYLGAYSVKAYNDFCPGGVSVSGTLTEPGVEKLVEVQLKELYALTVTVLNYDGIPVSEADVALNGNMNSLTDERGVCTFPMLSGGTYEVIAENVLQTHKGRAVCAVGGAEEEYFADVKLLGMGTVNVTVRDGNDGLPVENAQLKLYNIYFPRERHENPAFNSETKEYTFTNVHQGEFALSATDLNGLGGRVRGRVKGEGDVVSIEVTLRGYKTVTGTVWKPGGTEPAEDIRVVLYESSGNDPLGYCTSTAGGGFSFDYVPEKKNYRVVAVDPATGHKGSQAVTVHEGPPAEVDPVTVYLKGSGAVTGVVYSGDCLTPMQSRRVRLKPAGSYALELLTSATSDGTFSFENVPEGDFTVTAQDPVTGLMGKTTGHVGDDGVPVEVTICTQPTGTIVGRVFDASGDPLGGAVIEFEGGRDIANSYSCAGDCTFPGGEGSGCVLTGAGDFCIRNVPLGQFNLTAYRMGEISMGTSAGSISKHGQVVTVDIHLRGTGTVEGLVLSQGNPLSGHAVKILCGNGTITRVTDSSGSFSFSSIRVGTFSLEAYDPGNPSTGLRGNGAGEIAHDGQVVTLNIALEESGTVTGKIVMAGDGVTPMAGLAVALSGSGMNLYTKTDLEGRFLFEGVRPGSGTVSVNAALDGLGRARASWSLAAGGDLDDLGALRLDNTLPTVTVTPPPGSMNVDTGSAIQLQFSEPMDPDTLTGENIHVFKGSQEVTGITINVSGENRLVALQVAGGSLQSSVIYAVTVGLGVTDTAGNRMASALYSNFSTEDDKNPGVTSVSPAVGAKEVEPNDNLTLSIVFDEPMNTAANSGLTISMGGVSSTDPAQPVYSCPNCSYTWLGDSEVTFTPSAMLGGNVTYKVIVNGGKDRAGNEMDEYSWSFRTRDTIPPVAVINLPPDVKTHEEEPYNKYVVEGQEFDVEVTSAAPDVQGVFLMVNGSAWKYEPGASASFSVTVPWFSVDGNRLILQAKAMDTAGNMSAIAIEDIEVKEDLSPEVTLAFKDEPSPVVLPGGKVKFLVTANGGEPESVQFLATGACIPGTSIDNLPAELEPYTHEFTMPQACGAGSTVSVSALVKAGGGKQAVSQAILLQVPEDTTAPSIEITQPAYGDTFEDKTEITVMVQANDNIKMQHVTFNIDGLSPEVVTSESDQYQTKFTVYATNDTQTVNITAEAKDWIGNVSETSIPVIIAPLETSGAPDVSLIVPTPGTLVFPGEQLKLKMNVIDSGGTPLSEIDFLVDGATVEHIDTGVNGDHQFIWTVPDTEMGIEPPDRFTIRMQAKDGDYTSYVETYVRLVDDSAGSYQQLTGQVTIDDANRAQYEGKTLVIRGDEASETVVTFAVTPVEGDPFDLLNLLVKEHAVLTHSGTTPTVEHKLDIVVTGTVSVGMDAAIDVSEKGYLGGYQGEGADKNDSRYGRGHQNSEGSYLYSGASHGGFGASYNDCRVNAAYGSVYLPTAPGAGGGGVNDIDGKGGNGGGVIRLGAQAVILDGVLIANGGSIPENAEGGAGAGGSILLDTGDLKGIGTIEAGGGNRGTQGNSGAGGGGRIAVYYTGMDGFAPANVFAYGGRHPNTGNPHVQYNGAPGTVYFKPAEGQGQVVIRGDRGDNQTDTSILGVAGAGAGKITHIINPFRVKDELAVFVPGALAGMLLQPDIQRDETFVIIDNSGDEIEVEHLEGTDFTDGITTAVQREYRVKSPAGLTLTGGGAHLSGDVTLGPVTLDGARLVVDGTLRTPDLDVLNESVVTHGYTTADAVYKLSIIAADIYVDGDSKINVSGRGYLGGCRVGEPILDGTDEGYQLYKTGWTLNNTREYGSETYSGGSHGGSGGKDTTPAYTFTPNAVYGSVFAPTAPGSGGSGYVNSPSVYPGGSGGGVLYLEADSLLLDGVVSADGGTAESANSGGAGGAVYIRVTELDGGGSISANGGDSQYKSGGGGGRIALYYSLINDFELANVTAYGGKHNDSSGSTANFNGSAGTVYLKQENGAGTLVVDNQGKDSYRPMVFPVIPAAEITAISGEGNCVLEDSAAHFQRDTLIGMTLVPDITQPDQIFEIIGNDETSITVNGNLSAVTAVDNIYTSKTVYGGNLDIRGPRAWLDQEVTVGNLTLGENCILGMPPGSETYVGRLYIHATGTVTVPAGSSIDVSGAGYLGGCRVPGTTDFDFRTAFTHDGTSPGSPGGTRVNGSEVATGGSYGGLGGKYSSTGRAPNPRYGVDDYPRDPGSGGGGYIDTYKGGNGGGAVEITAGTLVLYGKILANGGSSPGSSAGGGSGGAVLLDVNILEGGGSIEAKGGVGPEKGSGGGGRVAVYYMVKEIENLDTKISVAGAECTDAGALPEYNGQDGTKNTYPKETGQ